MTMDVIVNPEAVEPAWLTAVLTKAGALIDGEVLDVVCRTYDGNWSSNAFLTLQYSDDAVGECPKQLFLKTSSDFGPSEVFYYTRDYIDVAAAPLVRCFDARYDEDQRCYHLLLEDLSTTHELVLHQPANLAYAEALADGFAAMHARWWGAERFTQIGETMPTADSVRGYVDEARPGLIHLRQHYSAEIGDENLDRIERFFAEHPDLLIERLSDERGFCLIHGDANPTNILVPRGALGPPIYLLDRQPFETSLTVFLGVYDITHAIVHRWERDNRRQLEVPLLRRFHRQLVANDVDNYSWQQLVDDYVLCAGMGLYDAVERSADGPNEEMKWLWLPMLQRSLQALTDLEDVNDLFILRRST